MLSAEDYLKSIKEKVAAHPFLEHPFLQLFSTQNLTREQAQKFALLYYPHIQRTRLYQACALGVTPDENIQSVLTEILYDEYGNGNNANSHMAIYRKLMRALDLTEHQISNPPILPEQQAYIDTMMRITQGQDWLAAIGVAGIAGEWPIPPYYTMLLKGLRTVPGLSDDDLQLFIEHIDLDVHHSHIVENAILPYLDSQINRDSLWRGIELNLNARIVQLNGLQREIFA